MSDCGHCGLSGQKGLCENIFNSLSVLLERCQPWLAWELRPSCNLCVFRHSPQDVQGSMSDYRYAL